MKKNVVKINESQLKNVIAESVKDIIKEWGGMHRTLSFEKAVRELREAWANYCGGPGSYLTTDDQAYVEDLIDYLEEHAQ